MGLAASQARFLNLTARKTNIEYEGQQINQQRTTLANQSASYYNQMLTLSVPTPPSTDSFRTINYAFTTLDGYKANVSQVTGQANNATVVYTYSQTENKIAATGLYAIEKNADGTYKSGARLIQTVSSNNSLKDEEAKIRVGIQAAQKEAGSTKTDNSALYYMNTGSNAAPNYVYFTKDELEATSKADQGSKATNGYRYADITTYNQGKYSNVVVSRDGNSRIQSLTVNGQALAVTTNSTTDEAAYEDAYNQYTYETYLYQQQLEEINAQTSVIQAQDKKLELRLKQLDTEQSAITTELESVSSVIKKNSEDSFKTFA